MTCKVAILAENDYEDLELWYPLLRLKEEGHDVKVVGPGGCEVYHSKHGYEVAVDLTADRADPADFEAVVIPGGWAPDRLRRYPAINEFVKALFNAGKPVAAICHGGSVLISAGVVKGRKATSTLAIRDDMINAGARWIDSEVVVDRNLITSRTPVDLPAFLKEIIKALR